MDEENIRVEYRAITHKLVQLSSFRFTLIGFYVTAMGVIATVGPDTLGSVIRQSRFVLMLWLTFCFWVLELRNRGLVTNISNRAIQIERECWYYVGKQAYDPFISHWRKTLPLNDSEADKPQHLDKDEAKLFLWHIKLPTFVSHSLGIDLLFLGVVIYSLWQILQI